MNHLTRLGAIVLALTSIAANGPEPNAVAEPAPAATAGLAYDQIVRLLSKATPPPPDSFAADAARIAALPPMPDSKAMFAALELASAMMSNPLTALVAQPASMAAAAAANAYSAKVAAASAAYRNAGGMMHAWFYHGWRRTDTPLGSVIVKPDQGLQISLNPAKRTYRETRAGPPAGPSVETYVLSDAPDAALTYASAPAFKSLGAMTIAGLPGRGYQTDASFAVSGILGICSSGNHVLSEVEYVAADVPDPQASPGTPLNGDQVAREACSPTMAGSHREPGRLVLFRSIALSGAGAFGDMVNVLERGNLRAIGAADTAIFSIPTDFTEER